MIEEPSHRMMPGLGVITWRSRILVYQYFNDQLVWARFLGAEEAEIDADLKQAIESDRVHSSLGK